ncbi:hypothetical protein NDU88_002788 [Pleurodeles waltl]|uniref:Uncharacterized protein n=1 Tax=Pleurodeles waltl TaxID=8319 RepID=A0AAV7RGP9_PLEWA|nr:hypothetical protein NDU88_002788 [Pleurodeles waltl]
MFENAVMNYVTLVINTALQYPEGSWTYVLLGSSSTLNHGRTPQFFEDMLEIHRIQEVDIQKRESHEGCKRCMSNRSCRSYLSHEWMIH